MKFLIQRADRFGDVVFSLPVIEQLKKHYPNATIHFIVSSRGKHIAENHPDIDHYWLINSSPSLASILSLSKQLKSHSYTHYIALWNNPRLHMLGFLASIPIRIGYRSYLLDRFYFTHHQKPQWDNLLVHTIEHNLNLLTPLGISSSLCRGTVSIPTSLSTVISKLLCRYSNKKRIVIFTETGGSNIPFPRDILDTFIQRMASTEKYIIILAGNNSTNEFIHHPSNNYVVNLISKTSFEDLIYLIHSCDYYIGPDTGPTHIASFLDKPSLFFSPLKKNPPSIFGTLSSKQIIIRQDYQYPKLSLKSRDYPKYLSYLTPDYLYTMFKKLENTLPKPLDDIKHYQIQHSLRMLYRPYDTESIEDVTRSITHQTNNNWRYFICNSSSISNIIQSIKEHNISIIQGNFSWFTRICINLYFTVKEAVLPPVFISEKLSSSFNIYSHYKAQFDK